jgi:uncharacterized membrane protein
MSILVFLTFFQFYFSYSVTRLGSVIPYVTLEIVD